MQFYTNDHQSQDTPEWESETQNRQPEAAAINLRSTRLMERLGFAHDLASDFDHPAIAEGHELRPHVLYRKAKES